jgi:hypothetical protein
MKSDPTPTKFGGIEAGPAFSAGLEAGLVGAILVLIEQLLQYFLNIQGWALLFCLLDLGIWFGVGALAVYWLKSKGPIERSRQTQAGILAGVITGLATAILLVAFAFIQGTSLESLPLPEGFPIETFNQFFDLMLICCFGLPTVLIATGASYLGSLVMRSFMGKEVQAPPQPEAQVTRLDAYLTKEGLPVELHPVVAAYQRGEVAEARARFAGFLRQSPRQVQAWLWFAVMLDNPVHQIESVKRALAIDPENEIARRMLAMLKQSAAKQP